MADLYERGSTELLALRPEVWSALFYSTLLEALPFNSSVATDYEGDIRALGDRVHISQFPQFSAATTMNEEDCIDADAVTAVPLELVVDKQIVKDFIVTERAKIQAIDAMNALRDLAMHSIMKKMQSLIIAATIPAVANQLAYTLAGTLALVDIIAAKEKLDSGNVPDDGTRSMVLDSPQWNQVFNITGLTSRDFVTEGSRGGLETGSLPARVLGFNPKLTTEAAGVAYFFHPSYMEIAVQRGLDVRVFDKGVQGCRSERVNVTLLMGELQASDIRVVTVS